MPERGGAIAKTRYATVVPYVTKDGSEIRELMHPLAHGSERQSLAEAIVAPGTQTLLHRHRSSEEIYHITGGTGVMTLDGETFTVVTGDTVLIPPGTPHRIRNTGTQPLRVLCACAPAYSHDDTELLQSESCPEHP
jgi:mannose-6-phosphate isomerase-like protein (cupin superfamily)